MVPAFGVLLIFIVRSVEINSDLPGNADFYDPNWTPFKNMVSALRGYNLRKGMKKNKCLIFNNNLKSS